MRERGESKNEVPTSEIPVPRRPPVMVSTKLPVLPTPE